MPSSNCSTVTTTAATLCGRLDDQCRSNRYIYIYIYEYKYKSIRSVTVSIPLISWNIHTPCGYIDTVPINLTRILSDNLNTWAINKYTNMLGDDNHAVAIW